jgi:outer membrane protein OmpA-like peptidoglycan-associated protein/opacity protein-like surface antigen
MQNKGEKSLYMNILFKTFRQVRIPIQWILLIVFLSFLDVYPQNSQPNNHGFQNGFIFGVDGGVTLPQTDYQNNKIEFSLRGTGEYFFKTNSIHLLGLKLKAGSEQIKGEDTRGTISTKDYPSVNLPPTFTTDIYSIGIAATYGISIGDVVIPYLSAGITNLWYFPEDDQGKPAAGGYAKLYDKTTIAYAFEFGIKFLVSDKLSINLSVNPYIPQSDYLDDVAAALSNDAYSSILIGFSYSPFFDNDPDGDDIKVSDDLCPEEAEDFDGFQDDDGCPDLDNDGDSILDINDKCPNEPEDFDGFEDQDGCSDDDNDGDGILDVNDKCPNEAEDIDGIEDEDGCPEEDEIITAEKFIISGDDIFSANSAMIKIEGKKQLDDIILQLEKFPDIKWRIEGHMDSNGNKRFIRNLSLERAKAVLEYFSYFGGLKRENFQVFGMGDNFPIADNNNEEGRIENRRIEIIPEVTDVIPDSTGKPEEEFNQFILRGDDAFESNTATMRELAKILLNEIAVYIKNQPESKWKIEGYTDNQGSASILKKLSLERANAVYDYLISQGLSSDQFTVLGLGGANPITNNDTEEGRSTNRRILIIRED